MTINKRKERQKGVKDNDEEGSCTTMRESFWLHGQGCSGQAQWPLMGPLHDEKHTNTQIHKYAIRIQIPVQPAALNTCNITLKLTSFRAANTEPGAQKHCCCIDTKMARFIGRCQPVEIQQEQESEGSQVVQTMEVQVLQQN